MFFIDKTPARHTFMADREGSADQSIFRSLNRHQSPADTASNLAEVLYGGRGTQQQAYYFPDISYSDKFLRQPQ